MAWDDVPPKLAGGRPAPVYWDEELQDWVAPHGRRGHAGQILYGPDGNPISVVDNKLAVRAAELEEKLEAVRVLLNALAGEDFATQTTLAQILEKMIAAPATEAKQDSLATLVGAIEDKLDGEDFATQTTLAQILAKMIASPATAAKQDIIAGHVDGVETLLTAIKDTDGIKKITDTVSTDMTSRFDTIKVAPVVGAKTVTTSAAEVFAGASRLASRYLMAVTNESSQIIYWGPSGVTVANGFYLYPGDTHIFRFSPAVATPVYMIAPASAQIRVGEMA
jgi:hypothetical protein